MGALICIIFWTIKSEEIVSLLTDNNYGLKNFTDYPIQIYSREIRLLLTFVVFRLQLHCFLLVSHV